MIVQFFDTDAGTAVYINPEYVVTLRPDPGEPERISIVKLWDGETFRVQGTHIEVGGQALPDPLGPSAERSLLNPAADLAASRSVAGELS
jgi:hypothetical protein